MKKIFTILAIVSVLGVVLAGCKSGDDAGTSSSTTGSSTTGSSTTGSSTTGS